MVYYYYYYFQRNIVYLSLKIDFVLANSSLFAKLPVLWSTVLKVVKPIFFMQTVTTLIWVCTIFPNKTTSALHVHDLRIRKITSLKTFNTKYIIQTFGKLKKKMRNSFNIPYEEYVDSKTLVNNSTKVKQTFSNVH